MRKIDRQVLTLEHSQKKSQFDLRSAPLIAAKTSSLEGIPKVLAVTFETGKVMRIFKLNFGRTPAATAPERNDAHAWFKDDTVTCGDGSVVEFFHFAAFSVLVSHWIPVNRSTFYKLLFMAQWTAVEWIPFHVVYLSHSVCHYLSTSWIPIFLPHQKRKEKSETEFTASVLKKKIQDTQEIKENTF